MVEAAFVAELDLAAVALPAALAHARSGLAAAVGTAVQVAAFWKKEETKISFVVLSDRGKTIRRAKTGRACQIQFRPLLPAFFLSLVRSLTSF